MPGGDSISQVTFDSVLRMEDEGILGQGDKLHRLPSATRAAQSDTQMTNSSEQSGIPKAQWGESRTVEAHGHVITETRPEDLWDTPDPGKDVASSPASHNEAEPYGTRAVAPRACQPTSVCEARTDRQRTPHLSASVLATDMAGLLSRCLSICLLARVGWLSNPCPVFHLNQVLPFLLCS